MKDPKDPGTGNLLATPNAVRQARFAAKMRKLGKRQRKFLVTDDEYEVLRATLERLRSDETQEASAPDERRPGASSSLETPDPR